MGSAQRGCGKASRIYYGISAEKFELGAEMESPNCMITSGDGVTLVADKKMLADASTFFRDILSTKSHLEEQVIQLPSLDGKMVELMMKIIKGEAYVDVWAEENKDVLAAAELVGIVPHSDF